MTDNGAVYIGDGLKYIAKAIVVATCIWRWSSYTTSADAIKLLEGR